MWKCWWGFHLWDLWQIRHYTSVTMFDKTPRPMDLQMRKCKRCGLEQTRSL